MRILVIQQKRIGDVLVSTVICNNLRKAYPTAQIDYMIYSFTKDVVVGNPNIDNVILFEDKDREPRNLRSFGKMISEREYDVIVDPYNKLETAVITLLSKAKRRIAFKSRYKIYNEVRPQNKYQNCPHGVILGNRLTLIEPLTEGKIKEFDYSPKIYLTQEELNECKIKLVSAGVELEKPIVVFGILGSVENKTYPVDYMLGLVDDFIEKYDCQILLNHFPNQHELAKEFHSKLKDSRNVFLNFWGDGLRDLASINHFADLYVGNDCGHPHIAKAVGTPTFTIFAPFICPKLWGILENIPQNDSFSIRDIDASFVEGKTKKEILEINNKLYQSMKPSLILSKISQLIKNNSIL